MLNTITESINSMGDFIDSLTSVIPKIIAGCAVLSSMVPKPIEAGAFSIFHKVVNFLGFNFGEAANKE